MEKISLCGLGSIGSFALLALACSAESATPPGGTGGSTGASGSSSLGGSTQTFGGTASTSGGATSSNGGTSSTMGGFTTFGGSTGTSGSTGTMGGSTATSGGSTGTMGGSTATSGGSTGTSGSTGTTGGSTGTTGGAPTAGSSGSGGAVTTCSDGCALLSVPFADYKTAQLFEIYLPAAVDFSAATVSVKLRATAGKAGGVQVVIKNGKATNYAWAQTAWNPISDLNKADWSTITLNAASPSSMSTTDVFDKTQVSIITIQIAAGDPWYSDMAMTMIDKTALANPTSVLVDEITVAGATGAGPWTFTTSASLSDLHYDSTTYMAITGSTATWIPPG